VPHSGSSRSLWETDGSVSFSGQWNEFDDVHADPKPAQHPMPLWVGGNAAAAQRRAAAAGDGWHPLFPTPLQYSTARAVIENRRRAAGRSGEFVFSYSCPPTQSVLDGSERPPPMSFDPAVEIPAEYGYAPPLPLTGDGRAMMTGTPDEVATDIAELAAAGVEHLALRFSVFDPTPGAGNFIEQLERFTVLVRPALEANGAVVDLR
jgi:alkanesulfonate monooxygenase SsuD/methylene tetrahydromethanopterin reductase-like flavin-dependent oxidoreductase (luciferase family)